MKGQRKMFLTAVYSFQFKLLLLYLSPRLLDGKKPRRATRASTHLRSLFHAATALFIQTSQLSYSLSVSVYLSEAAHVNAVLLHCAD